MIRPRFTDPIGPGTAAWDAFDKAVEAYRNVRVRHQRDRWYKRFYNQRRTMIDNLRRHGGDVAAWCQSLRDRVEQGDGMEDDE